MVNELNINIKYFLNTKAKGSVKKHRGFDDILYHFPLVVRLNIGRLKGGYNVKSLINSQVYLTQEAFDIAFENGRPISKILSEQLRLDQQEEIIKELIHDNSNGIDYKLKDVVKRFRKESLFYTTEFDRLLFNAISDLESMSRIDEDYFISHDVEPEDNQDLMTDWYGITKSFITESDWQFLDSSSRALSGFQNISEVYETAIALNYYFNNSVLKSDKSRGTIYSFKWKNESNEFLNFIRNLDIKKLDKFYQKPHKIRISGGATFFYLKLGFRVDPSKSNRYVDIIEQITEDHFTSLL